MGTPLALMADGGWLIAKKGYAARSAFLLRSKSYGGQGIWDLGDSLRWI
jgi:hypothetical protein